MKKIKGLDTSKKNKDSLTIKEKKNRRRGVYIGQLWKPSQEKQLWRLSRRSASDVSIGQKRCLLLVWGKGVGVACNYNSVILYVALSCI